jgi:hypothetical protein
LKSAIVKQTRHAQQRKLLKLYDYHACAGAERVALGAKADQVVRISAKPIYVFQALVQYRETHRVVASGLQLSTGRCQPRARQKSAVG